MRPIETAEIARGIANIAISMGVASTLPVAEEAQARVIEMFAEQLRAQHINLEVREVNGDFFAAEVRKRVLSALLAAQRGLADSALPQRFYAKMARIVELLSDGHFNGIDAKARLDELLHDLVRELSEPMFLHVELSKRAFYEQKEPLFGALVDVKFPNASRDIAAAGRCFALDEWTACVSHLMRSLESPLQFFANRVGVTFPGPTDLENWRNIVDQMCSKIEAEVKRLEGTPKSHARNEELQLLGDVALDFRHFKNAWRNNVAHGREWYDEREAERVYGAVEHFMQRMAEFA